MVRRSRQTVRIQISSVPGRAGPDQAQLPSIPSRGLPCILWHGLDWAEALHCAVSVSWDRSSGRGLWPYSTVPKKTWTFLLRCL
jgi:hypothetical protein